MPAVLTDTHLADPCVPMSWLPVLESLREFLALEQRLRESSVALSEGERAELVRLHDGLMTETEAILEPAAIADISRSEAQQILLRAVLGLLQLRQVVLSGDAVLDTAGSRTLTLFEADFYESPENVQSICDRVQTVLGLSNVDMARQADVLHQDLADARRKQQLVRALRDEFSLWPNAIGLRAGVAAFWGFVYPAAPLIAPDVELIVTGTLVFFCLPLTKDLESLYGERFRSLADDDQLSVRAFLKKLKRFAQERFANFPAFGLVEGASLDSALLKRLAARARLSEDVVRQELPRVVTILPLDEIDKYLIHDVWGHGWQASMLRFDNMYQQIAEFADPLDLSENSATSASPNLLAGCFRGSGESLELDDRKFREFAMAEVCQRLPVALSAVLAEMLADVAEFKFLVEHPDLAALLPTSSHLPEYPALLDLTMADIPFYFAQATKVFRSWSEQPQRQARLIEQLVRAGGTRESAERAVDRAVQIWNELKDGYFRPELSWEPTADGLQVNAFTRIALNFVGLHRAILQTYRELAELSPRSLPLKSFRDLLVIAAGVFFEFDPARNLWRVDEFLTLMLIPFCRGLTSSDDGPSNTPVRGGPDASSQ